MDRVRQVTAAAWLAALAAVGCASTTKVTETVTQAMKSVEGLATPAAPATQFMCLWQRRLAPLPDPTKDGLLAPGLAGQMFLLAADGGPADVAGDVTVALYDDTPGRPAATPEVYHFTKDTVKKLVTNDERFGRSYVLYLPWPPGWKDVTTVRILSRYEAPGVSLHSGEVRLALDLSESAGPVWQEQGEPLGAPRAAGFDARTVPDGAKVIRQVQSQTVVPVGGPIVVGER